MYCCIRVPCQAWSGNGYAANPLAPGVSLIHAVYVRLREDKKAVASDAGFAQVTAIVQLTSNEVAEGKALPRSEVILREVYCKKGKDGDMVQKFMAWKTYKESIDPRFPAYVFHYTNYSPVRAEPLKREIRVSSKSEQIMAIAKGYIEENVKKGWDKA